jgi:predicted NBD/HSP70 family sugar kinase
LGGFFLTSQLADGDEQTVERVHRAGTCFGYTPANPVHLYNPDVMVIGGAITTCVGYMEAAKAALQAHALPE